MAKKKKPIDINNILLCVRGVHCRVCNRTDVYFAFEKLTDNDVIRLEPICRTIVKYLISEGYLDINKKINMHLLST